LLVDSISIAYAHAVRDRWTGLELRYLVTLAAVGREASFSRAADALGYTQSAVSQQISRLEHITGTRLVERPGGPRPVSLTPAGRLLAGHAEAIGARLASAAADLDALAGGTAGVLRVGCYQSVGARLLPPVLREFTAAWPRVEVRLSETQDDGELLADLEGGRLDLTFVVFPLTTGPFEAVELLEDPYVLAVPEDSELGRRPSPVSLRHLTGVPLITYAQMREVHSIENRLGRPQLRHQIAFRSHDNATILGLAAAGVGAAIISWLSVDPYRPGLRLKRLAKVSPRIVGIAWHRDRYRIPAADAFVRLTQRAAEREQSAARLQLGSG
jgi:DNA-binding transcriptional LysR family regulator